MRSPNELRKLAAWYREFAERAGEAAIWEARLRTAKELEAEAARVESNLPPSPRARRRIKSVPVSIRSGCVATHGAHVYGFASQGFGRNLPPRYCNGGLLKTRAPQATARQSPTERGGAGVGASAAGGT